MLLQAVDDAAAHPLPPDAPAGTTQRGDPRPSLQERYANRADYVAEVRAAALALRDQRFVLPDDVDTVVHRAETTTLLP
jgi:hypothetical protein